jgi:predicted helicase
MMHPLSLKPTHKPVKAYYEALKQFKSANISHETAVRSAFQELLHHCCRQVDWKLIPEFSIRRTEQSPIRVDGALLDDSNLTRGYWEAKDSHDDLEEEVDKKFRQGYPKDNILFQAPERAILYQKGKLVFDEDITKPDRLVETLRELFSYRQPVVMQWEEAATEFKDKIPELAKGVLARIEEERKTNQRFIRAFADFVELCRHSVNPNLSVQAVEEMLIQHLLTERIFRTVFKNSDFTRRNVIAAEIEKVIDALTSQAFSKQEFLSKVDKFYRAIEEATDSITDFAQKQHFLNTVYEKFFQGFSVKVADTHGIVYTPQPIVNFMVKSVEEILQKEFGRSLSDKGVHILDPFVGTGTFIVRVMQEIKRQALTYKYQHELHCNEVMLLPYYIASMNIEHEFFEKIGEYKPFEGICLVDTFELAEPHQAELFTTQNTERVERQKKSPIFVIVGNPPYNAWQLNENDNNKNRKYQTMDDHVADTYAKASSATNKNALSDPYVKAFRWASERIGDEGIVAFVSNNSFLDQIAFDGMRAYLANDFDAIYVLDLGGNVRKNPKLSGTTHNVFGIQVGVSISLLVRKKPSVIASEAPKGQAKQSQSKQEIASVATLPRNDKTRGRIFHARVDEFWRKEQKYHYLEEVQHRQEVEWKLINPDEKNTWLTEGLHDEFENFLPMGTKDAKAGGKEKVILELYSNGVKTNRDAWACNFNVEELARNMSRTIDTFGEQAYRWNRLTKKPKLDDFIKAENHKISWSEGLKNGLLRGTISEFDSVKIRRSFYRPFTQTYLYFDKVWTERRYQFPRILPTPESEEENKIIWLKVGTEQHMYALMVNLIPDLLPQGGSQCFPFYTYDEDGSNRRENITDWAVEEFSRHYRPGHSEGAKRPKNLQKGSDPSSHRKRGTQDDITKWDIFHYIYALLHHPTYRERYAANLRRELPRIPFVKGFWEYVEAGRKLARLHVEYEKQKQYKLDVIESKVGHLNYRVGKMKLSKDKKTLIYNDFFTLGGIPKEAFEHRLGNRSAFEWIIDQYQVSTDKRSGITNDPNRADDPEYIMRLIGQVITVSVETVKILKGLPTFEVVSESKKN